MFRNSSQTTEQSALPRQFPIAAACDAAAKKLQLLLDQTEDVGQAIQLADAIGRLGGARHALFGQIVQKLD